MLCGDECLWLPGALTAKQISGSLKKPKKEMKRTAEFGGEVYNEYCEEGFNNDNADRRYNNQVENYAIKEERRITF